MLTLVDTRNNAEHSELKRRDVAPEHNKKPPNLLRHLFREYVCRGVARSWAVRIRCFDVIPDGFASAFR